MNKVDATNWAKGSNNISDPERMPEGFARSLVNLDVGAGGRLTLRPGFSQVYAGTSRGILALNEKLLIADGSSLVEFNTENSTSRILRSIAGAGRFVGDTHNNRLYFCTADEALEYDGTDVIRWGVLDAINSLPLSSAPGGLSDAHYRIAITYTDELGREGGTGAAMLYRASGGIEALLPDPPQGHKVNLYVGSANGASLYLQASSAVGGPFTVTRIDDASAQLETLNRYAPVPSDLVVSHNGSIAMSRGGLVELTQPMRPHLIDRLSGFYQYPKNVGCMVSAGALYISADKSYAITSAETGEPVQRVIADYPAIPGTAAMLPDDSAAWVTERGLFVLKDGAAQAVTQDFFVPAPARHGASGVIDNHGSARIVTTTQAHRGLNRLAASDRFDAEITYP